MPGRRVASSVRDPKAGCWTVAAVSGSRLRRWCLSALGALIAALAATGCGDGEGAAGAAGAAGVSARGHPFPGAPTAPDRPPGPRVDAALDQLVRAATMAMLDREALEVVADSGDARLGWLLADLLRFTSGGDAEDALVSAFIRLTGTDVTEDPSFEESSWRSVTDHLIAWDLPAPPGYRERKARLFLTIEPAWEPFFSDRDAEIDWRLVSWGGVFIDNREAGSRLACPRGCIPALDDPALTGANGGAWYSDDEIVFGVVVGGEAVAFPKNIMEVHEMVNITVGGRRLGIPYCTLCGSAQAYLLDSVPNGFPTPVLRTSGLLSRSNKVMYDLSTLSVLDTFTGRALSGPLQEAGVTLRQTSVTASTWGAWKRAHPETRIVAEDGGIGRRYPDDPLGGRDDEGPIFPVGDVDPRLPVQEHVVGVIGPGGTPVAFPVERALAALTDGQRVAANGVEVTADGDGLRASTRAGRELPAHQAFWFAWSQFHPDTVLWMPTSAG
jgi:Protein of unknown function (DUF3179)